MLFLEKAENSAIAFMRSLSGACVSIVAAASVLNLSTFLATVSLRDADTGSTALEGLELAWPIGGAAGEVKAVSILLIPKNYLKVLTLERAQCQAPKSRSNNLKLREFQLISASQMQTNIGMHS